MEYISSEKKWVNYFELNGSNMSVSETLLISNLKKSMQFTWIRHSYIYHTNLVWSKKKDCSIVNILGVVPSVNRYLKKKIPSKVFFLNSQLNDSGSYGFERRWLMWHFFFINATIWIIEFGERIFVEAQSTVRQYQALPFVYFRTRLVDPFDLVDGNDATLRLCFDRYIQAPQQQPPSRRPTRSITPKV